MGDRGFGSRPGWMIAVGAAALLCTLLIVGAPAQAAPRPAPAAGCPTAGPAEMEAIARAYFAAFNSGDVAALDALLAADYRQPQGAVVTPQDRALHLERLRAVRSGFPDGVFTIRWMIVDGDTVAVRHEFRGTQQGEYAGIAPTGRPVAVGAFHVHRIVCGQIAETWNAGDGLGLLRQLGAIPGPATTDPGDEPRPVAATTRTPCPATTPAQNTTAARRWYTEALNQGRFNVLDQIVAGDVVHHAALFVDLVGREAVADTLRLFGVGSVGFPDIQYTIDGVVASGDMVLVRWTGRGTHRGEFLGIPATGAGVAWSGMNAFRFACGVIVEGWSEANGLQILRQIGGVP